MIAIEFAGWAPSAATACQAMRERGGGELWPAWFEARALERQGRAPEAHEAYASLTGAFPAFGPGWDGLERSLVAQHGPGWSAERMQLRASRSEAKGGQAASEVDLAIDDACARMLLGERREAIADLEATLEAAKGANRSAQLLLAELHLRGAGVGRATGALRAALPTSRRLTDDPVVGLLVNNLLQEALRELEKGTTSNLARTERDLARLIESYPSDPLPVLAWSRLRAEAEDRNPALVVDVITKAFEALRDRTAGQPLASLRSDAAQEWGSFLLTIAPDVAETFLLEDLAVTPGDLDLWRLLAQAIAAQDRPEDATDLYEALVTMSSDPLAHEAYAWFLLERGASADKVQEHLKRASILAADEPIDALRSKFVAALAQLRLSEDPKISGLINSFSQLWERRGDLTGVSTQRLGRAYITALIQRREGKDRRTIQAVLAELTRGSELDPYVADLARAMAGIERHLPDVSAEEEDRRRKRSSD
ncbi:MAG: hypothetical protein O2816_03910, partial [Planctomycetota bacterium]|nr:hypothetical protein [Planctomycetota bacterium]